MPVGALLRVPLGIGAGCGLARGGAGGITRAVVNRALEAHLAPVHAGMAELQAEQHALKAEIAGLKDQLACR